MAIHSAKPSSNGHDLTHFEQILLERRTSLLEDARSIEREEEAAGEAAGVSFHLAEQGTDRSTHDVNLERMQAVTLEIQDIDAALERIREGDFGLCDTCGESIPKERLEAIPYARLCLRCKKAEETL